MLSHFTNSSVDSSLLLPCAQFPTISPVTTGYSRLPFLIMCLEKKQVVFIDYRVGTEPGKPGKKPYYEKSWKAWNCQGIFYKFYPSQGKVRENILFSQHMIFIYFFS